MIMSIKEVKLDNYFCEYGLYDMIDVLNNLECYIDIDLNSLVEKFCCGNNITSVDEVISYCTNNFDRLSESNFCESITSDVIDSRIRDYEILLESYNIYKHKGLELIELMQYIIISGKINFVDGDKELYLKKLDIYHKNSVVSGRDIVGMLVSLRNINMKLDMVISKINNMENYHRKQFDWYTQSFKDMVLPSKSLIYDTNKKDITCIRLNRKRCI